MSAQDNLSQELFFEAHRGVRLQNSEKTNKAELGMHWSADKDKAEEFGTKHMHWEHERGEVYHAQVPISAVETGHERLRDRGFANFNGKDPLGEKEVPVKEGATVKVTGVTKYRRKFYKKGNVNSGSELKERTRRYSPPREMKA